MYYWSSHLTRSKYLQMKKFQKLLDQKKIIDQPGRTNICGHRDQRATGNIRHRVKRRGTDDFKIVQLDGGLFRHDLLSGGNQRRSISLTLFGQSLDTH